jgi:hypothetical protein
MPKILQILFSAIFLVALVYLAVVGLVAFFDWVNPGGGSGRVARITIGAIIGLGVAAGIVVYRRFRGGS